MTDDNNREVTELAIDRKECPKCGAIWLNGVHTWATGVQKPGSEVDLAGLVCQKLGDETCINPQRNVPGGDSWEKRLDDAKKRARELDS